MKNEYNFPVEFRPIETVKVVGGRALLIHNKFAVVRTDKELPLGVVSKKYALLPHADVVDGFRKVFAEEEVKESVRMSHDGARMHYEIQFPKIQVQVSPKDKMTMRIVVQNSYDGSKKLQIILGAFRLVCSNGMTIGRKFLSFDRRHIGNVELQIEAIKKQMVEIKENFKNTQPILQEMAKMHMPTPEAEKLFDRKRVHLPSYLLKEAAEEFKKADDNSAWGVYNALTYAITHKMKKENPQAALKYGQRAWDTVAALFK